MVQTASPRTSRARHARPERRRGLAILLTILVVAVGLSVAAVGYYQWCGGGSGPQRPVTVVIEPGTSASGVLGKLHDQGVIRCSGLVGKVLLHEKGSPDFRAGTFQLTTNMTLDEAIAVLSKRPHHARTVSLTIPPGFRLTQIAERVHEVLPRIPAKDLLSRATSGDFPLPPYLPKGTKTTEGFLFPETYRVAVKTANADSVIRLLLDQFREEAANLPWQNTDRLDVTPYQAVIVASMIEREAAVDKERPLVAAVIYNRLRMGMQLGIDATLLYDDPTPGDGQLTDSDLETDTPYNTRIHTGLPPTPIASPQLASLRAALEPADVAYLYYVLCPKDGQGIHRFSISSRTFINNKHECLGD